MGMLIKNEFYKLKREWFMAFLLLLSLLPILTGGAGAVFNNSTKSLADLFFFMNNQFSMFFPMVIFILIGSLFYQEWIKPETQGSAVINAQFAQANGLKIGDTFSLEIESGKKVAVTVIGEYLTGNESQQEKTTAAVYRMENQIYIDNTTYVNLFDNCGFYKVLAYTGQPELLDTLAGSIQEILQEKADITTSDALYQQMKAPLTQITRVVALMRLLTFFTGTMIVSLLLCMWMRSRQKEMAVLISMGEQKHIIFLQALLEATIVFLIALVFACGFGTLTASWLQNLLFSSVETGASLEVSLQFTDVALLLGIGSGVVMIAVLLSLLPVIRANPKDILSRMEG